MFTISLFGNLDFMPVIDFIYVYMYWSIIIIRSYLSEYSKPKIEYANLSHLYSYV